LGNPSTNERAMHHHFEELVAVDRFRMSALRQRVLPLLETHAGLQDCIPALKKLLGERYHAFADSLIRNIFLIELVKLPEVSTTKFQVRWCDQLAGDPRECSFEECLSMAVTLLNDLCSGWLDVGANCEALLLCLSHSLLPYELPLEYLNRPLPGDTGARLHQQGNLIWAAPDLTLRTLRLRRYLLEDGTSPDAAFFRKVLDDKIKVKTYLTDRAQTGDFKTNRE
jgi:hypothetical protein